MSVIEEIRDLILLDKEKEENRYWKLSIDGSDLYILPLDNMKFTDMIIMGFRATRKENPLSSLDYWTRPPYLITLQQKWPIVVINTKDVISGKQIGYKITIDRDRLREWNLQNLLGSN